jgi:meiotically up-regulated gene 157 (Mug157) protein
VFDCKWELDSLASFLQISTAYYERTGDLEFFNKYTWVEGVQAAVEAAGAMRLGTYSEDGKVQKSAYTFTGYTNRGSETLTNEGLGNPTKENGMIRTAFRPSDDACIYQLLVPANMMWAKYLEDASLIMEKLDGEKVKNLTNEMREQAVGIRKGIAQDAIFKHKAFGDIFAYEIDGYGGANLMDDGECFNFSLPVL